MYCWIYDGCRDIVVRGPFPGLVRSRLDSMRLSRIEGAVNQFVCLVCMILWITMYTLDVIDEWLSEQTENFRKIDR